MTLRDDANVGRFPTKGLNFQILLQFESVMEKMPDTYQQLKGKYGGKYQVLDGSDASLCQSVLNEVPHVLASGSETEIRQPEEWHAFLFLLCTSVYFDVLMPMERFKAEGSLVQQSPDEAVIINQAMDAVQVYLQTGQMNWPEALPNLIDEDHPSEDAWQKIKSLYIQAQLMIMLHEVSHILHDDISGLSGRSPEELKEIEHRCDEEAAIWLLERYDEELPGTSRFAIAIALGSVVMFTRNQPSATHPEPVTRAQETFLRIGVEASDAVLLVQTLICAWTLKISGVDFATIRALFESGQSVESIYDSVVEVMRYQS